MIYYDLGELAEAVFIKRLNRFAALVELNYSPIEVHVANTGRMRELLYPGAHVWLKKATNPKRKLAYDLLLGEYAGRKICLNAQLANDFVDLWLQNGLLRELGAYNSWRREYRYGASRFDFLLEDRKKDEKMLLEVKSVNYRVGDAAVFPDAPTERGAKHLEELLSWQKQGLGQSAICFVVMGHDVKYLHTNETTDPLFDEALRQAQEAGVRVLVYKSFIKENRVYFEDEINYQR